MIRYRASPGGGAPIVEADAEDIEELRPMLVRHVQVIGAEERHVADVVQDTMLTTWEALHEAACEVRRACRPGPLFAASRA